MAVTKNMAYDHPSYTSVHLFGGVNAAGANSVQARFAAFTSLLPKSLTASVITAGTGTGNATLTLVKVLGTNTSSYCTVTMGTAAAGVTTNVLCTSTVPVAAGEVLHVQGGADATGVWATGIEYVIQPGASVTP